MLYAKGRETWVMQSVASGPDIVKPLAMTDAVDDGGHGRRFKCLKSPVGSLPALLCPACDNKAIVHHSATRSKSLTNAFQIEKLPTKPDLFYRCFVMPASTNAPGVKQALSKIDHLRG